MADSLVRGLLVCSMVAVILISPAKLGPAKIFHFIFCPAIASSRNARRRTSAIHHSANVTNVIRVSRQFLSFEGYAKGRNSGRKHDLRPDKSEREPLSWKGK